MRPDLAHIVMRFCEGYNIYMYSAVRRTVYSIQDSACVLHTAVVLGFQCVCSIPGGWGVVLECDPEIAADTRCV